MTSYSIEYLFAPFEVAVQGMSPPNFLCITNLLAGRTAWESEKSLSLCKYSSVTTKASVYYHHYFNQNSKTQNRMSLCEEN